MNARRWLSILLALVPLGAMAAVSLTIDPGDNPLDIAGWLDDPPTGVFAGNLRVTAGGPDPGAAPNKKGNAADDAQGGGGANAKGGGKALEASGSDLRLLLLPSDLKLKPADGASPQTGSTDVIISRSNVTLSGNPGPLTPGVPTDVAIQVGGISRPGLYTGTLNFALGASPNQRTAVPLTVRAYARPVLKPLSEKWNLNLVQRGGYLADMFFSKSALADTWELGFQNTSAAQANWGAPVVEIRGDQTGSQLTTQVLPSREGGIAPGAIGKLAIALTRKEMAPDHYTGTLYLSIAGAKDYLKVPVDLNVRTGPFFPLVAIFLGVMLGQFVQYMQTRGETQAASLDEVERVARALARAQPEDRALLAPQLETVRQAVYEHKLDKVAADLASIEGRIVQLEGLRRLEAGLPPDSAAPGTTKALAAIAAARRKIDFAEDAVASIEEARKAVEAANVVAESAVSFDVAAAREPGAGGQGAGPTSWWTEVRAYLGDSARNRERGAWLALHVWRPLMHVLLFLGLVAVGFSTLYLNQPTFGAQPFGDYLTLILWGLSADVARRTLATLPPAR